MKNIAVFILFSLVTACTSHAFAQADSLGLVLPDSGALELKTGTIELSGGVAKMRVPNGFRFLGPEGSHFVLETLWGNPRQNNLLGMLFPEKDSGHFGSWAFVINFEDIGYVKDEDADDINYDELLEQMKEESIEENKIRVKEGFPAVHIIGWASKPYYDKNKKALHWARELDFSDTGEHTLNYNIRLLGRKGVLSLNAVGVMSEMPEIKTVIDPIIAATEFKQGSRYVDFDEDVDDVAAWTIGGLVAGKILAKVGFFAVLVKFWKLIAIGVVAAGAYVVKLFRRRKNEQEEDNEGNTENHADQNPEE
jgi:uncharacterized membrane-anchored protein